MTLQSIQPYDIFYNHAKLPPFEPAYIQASAPSGFLNQQWPDDQIVINQWYNIQK